MLAIDLINAAIIGRARLPSSTMAGHFCAVSRDELTERQLYKTTHLRCALQEASTVDVVTMAASMAACNSRI